MTTPNPQVPDPNAHPGYPQAGPEAYGPAVPAQRRLSYMPAGILFGIGLLLALAPVVGWDLIGSFDSGGRADSSDIYALAQLLIYLLPIGIILILISGIVAIVVAVVNSSPQK